MTDTENPRQQSGGATRESPAEVNAVPLMKIHWLLMILLGAIVLTGCAGLLSTAVANGPEATGHVAWVFGFLLILPMIVAAGVFRLSGRSNRAANIAFAITTFGIIIPQSIAQILLSRHDGSGAKNAMAEMSQIAKESQSTDLDSGKLEQLGNRSAAALEKLKDGLSGSSRVIAAFMQQQTALTFKLQSDYMKEIEAFSAAGGLDKIDESSVDDVKGKLTMIDAAIKSHDLLMSHLSTLGARVQEEMTRAGCSTDEKQAMLAAMNRPVPLELAVQVSALEHRLLAPIRQKLEILHDHFGYWKSGENGAVVMMEDFPKEKLAEFNEAAAEFGRIAKEQKELREKIAARQAKQ